MIARFVIAGFVIAEFVIAGCHCTPLCRHSLIIHDQRSANTRPEKPRIREESSKIGPVALIKLDFILSKPINQKNLLAAF